MKSLIRAILLITLTLLSYARACAQEASDAGVTSAIAPVPGNSDSLPVDFIVQINVPHHFEVKEAVGILLSGTTVTEKPALDIRKINDGLSVISFGYAKGEAKQDSFATAMVVASNGETAFGDVRSVFGTASKGSFYSIPQCPRDKLPRTIDASKTGAFETLVNFRSQRRDTYRKELAEKMNGTFLSDLQKLEKGFGMTRGKQLDSDLNPIELIDRLSRLATTVKELREKENSK